jgi:hypothetical protein
VSYSFVFLSGGYDLDFTLYFPYLFSAWTFNGGEFPTAIWLISILLFVPGVIGTIIIMRKFNSE